VTRSKSLKGLGAKYWATLRKRYTNIYRTMKAKKEWPYCYKMRLKRVYTVAGGAYDVSPSKAQQR
jgi:ribosomal protein L37AE/L43A